MGRRSDRPATKGLTLDAGALIAFDRGDEAMRALLRRAHDRGIPIIVPTCALAQAWRYRARQARLAALVGSDDVCTEDLTCARAQAVGELCRRRNTSDIVDAFVALVARQFGGVVITSDPKHLHQLDPSLDITQI